LVAGYFSATAAAEMMPCGHQLANGSNRDFARRAKTRKTCHACLRASHRQARFTHPALHRMREEQTNACTNFTLTCLETKMKSEQNTTHSEINTRDINDRSEREQMIAIAAYLKAEKRGFTPNHDLDDWLEAEIEIEGFLNSFQA
jgi:hypothetical protein